MRKLKVEYEKPMRSGLGIHLWTRCSRSDLTAWGVEKSRPPLLTRSTSCHVASQVLIAFDRGRQKRRESGAAASDKTWSE